MKSEDEERLGDVIRSLLNRHTHLHEKRIQKLVFLADLHSIQTRGKRLVEADFKRYYHGVYSEMVSLKLQGLEGVDVRPDIAPDGSATLAFLKPKKALPTPHLLKEDLLILEETLRACKSLSTEELAEIGKTTLLWESAEFGQPLDYDSYLRDPSTRLSPEMRKAFDAAIEERKRARPKSFGSVDEMYAESRS